MWNKFKQMPIAYPVVIMLLISLVITAALAGTNALTVDKIAEINKKNENDAMARLIKADEYNPESVELEGKEYEYYEAVSGDKTEGYIITVGEKGYGGTDTVMVAIDKEGAVKEIEVLDVTNETPGLGQNTANKKFTDQFKGKSGELTAVKFGTASGENQIDAVASATISSRAITNAVNKAIKIAEEITKNAPKDSYGGSDTAVSVSAD